MFFGEENTAPGNLAKGVASARLDGKRLRIVLDSGLGDDVGLVGDLKLDLLGSRLFLTHTDSSQTRLSTSALDGTKLVDVPLDGPPLETDTRIAVDLANGKIYFAERVRQIISVAPLGGGARTTLVNLANGNGGNSSRPVDVALDPKSDRLYFIHSSLNQGTDLLSFIDLGQQLPTVVDVSVSGPALKSPTAIALDPKGIYMYVAERDEHRISRVPLGGGAREVIPISRDGMRPIDIAVDPSEERVFFTGSAATGSPDDIVASLTAIRGNGGIEWEFETLISQGLAFDSPSAFAVPDIIPGDVNGDGKVDLSDFGTLKANFGKENVSYSGGDIDLSDFVGLDDFGILKANFGKRAGAVPEPTSAFLVVMACACLCLARASPWRR